MAVSKSYDSSKQEEINKLLRDVSIRRLNEEIERLKQDNHNLRILIDAMPYMPKIPKREMVRVQHV